MHIPTKYGRPYHVAQVPLYGECSDGQLMILRRWVHVRAWPRRRSRPTTTYDAQRLRSTSFGSRGHGCMRLILKPERVSTVGERSISGTGPSHNGLIQAVHCHTPGPCTASIRTSGLHRVQEMERSSTPTCAAVTLLIIKCFNYSRNEPRAQMSRIEIAGDFRIFVNLNDFK